jgi:hypothetical protein
MFRRFASGVWSQTVESVPLFRCQIRPIGGYARGNQPTLMILPYNGASGGKKIEGTLA